MLSNMMTVHVTYPDGNTAEGRYRLTLDEAIDLYDSWPNVTQLGVEELDDYLDIGGES